MRSVAAAVLALAACSSHHDAQPPDAHPPDAAPDSPAVGNVVTIDLGGVTPDLIAYRDGTAAWQTPTASAAGVYPIHVTDAYTVLAVCVDPTYGSDVELISQTFSGEGASALLGCGFGPPPPLPPPNEAVTGQMLQAGQIVLGDSASSTTAPWTYDLQVPMGNHDLIAVGTDNKIELMHGIAVNGPMTLNVDLANGAALIPVNETVNGTVSGETVSAHTLLLTENEYIDFDQADGTNGFVIPTALLAASDVQRFRVTATTATTDRWVSITPPGPATVTLLPQLTGVTFGAAGGDLEVTFGTLPAIDAVNASVYSTAGNASENLTVSSSFLAKTGTQHLVIDTSAPGFQPSWRVDLLQGHSSGFSAYRTDAPVFLETDVSSDASSLTSSRRERARRHVR